MSVHSRFGNIVQYVLLQTDIQTSCVFLLYDCQTFWRQSRKIDKINLLDAKLFHAKRHYLICLRLKSCLGNAHKLGRKVQKCTRQWVVASDYQYITRNFTHMFQVSALSLLLITVRHVFNLKYCNRWSRIMLTAMQELVVPKSIPATYSLLWACHVQSSQWCKHPKFLNQGLLCKLISPSSDFPLS